MLMRFNHGSNDKDSDLCNKDINGALISSLPEQSDPLNIRVYNPFEMQWFIGLALNYGLPTHAPM